MFVGPDVKFHHAKLNVKSERGTRGFKWHQGHSCLAAHRLQPGDDRHLSEWLRRCARAADFRARQPSRAVCTASTTTPVISLCGSMMRWCVRFLRKRSSPPRVVPARRCCLTAGPSMARWKTARIARARCCCRSIHRRIRSPTRPALSLARIWEISCAGDPARFASFDMRACELPPDFRAGYTPPWVAARAAGAATSAYRSRWNEDRNDETDGWANR